MADDIFKAEKRLETKLALLVEGAQRDDPDSQRALYYASREKVFRIAERMVGSNDADDVSQQAFLKLFQTIRQFHGESRFETWMHRLVVNECLQHLRSRRRRPATALDVEPQSEGVSHVRAIEGKEMMERALDRLEPELRALLVLREIEQLSYTEIASIAGLNEGTVASRLNRARHEMRESLTRLGWEPPQ